MGYIDAGVPQGSILGPLLFLIYINDLTNDLSSSAKLFADDTSLFSVVFNVDVTSKELNDDLVKVQDWALRWKMSFNLDISKQAQEVIFSRKLKKTPHPPLMFNSNLVNKASSQKHLGIVLDDSLSFEEHLKPIHGFTMSVPVLILPIFWQLLVRNGKFRAKFRHNTIRDLTAKMLTEVCKDVSVEPHLHPITGETLDEGTANTSDEARLDIAARGFSVSGKKAFFDVRVFNPVAGRYRNSKIPKACELNEKEKKDNATNEY